MALKKTNLKDAIAQNGKAYDNANDKNKENVKMMFGFSPDMNKVKNAGKKPLRMTKAEALAYQEKLKNDKNAKEENQVFDANKDMVIPSPVKSENKANIIKNNSVNITTPVDVIEEEINVVKQGANAEETIIEQAKLQNKIPVNIELTKLSKSPKNVFKELKENVFNELKESIKSHGLYTPITIRPKESMQTYKVENEYEILAGHNRFLAFQELGYKDIPAFIIDCDDVNAVKLINDTNIQRDEVSELEKAWAYRTLFEQMNRKGTNQYSVEWEEEQSDTESNCKKIDNGTTEKIGADYGVSARTIERKIRLTYLNKNLYRKYQRNEITQDMAIDLSYLSKQVQDQICEDMKEQNLYLTSQNCKDLKNEWKKFEKEKDTKEFARNRFLAILERDNASSSDNAKTDGGVKKTIPKYIVEDYLFPVELKKKDRCVYISKALTYIKENNISLMEG